MHLREGEKSIPECRYSYWSTFPFRGCRYSENTFINWVLLWIMLWHIERSFVNCTSATSTCQFVCWTASAELQHTDSKWLATEKEKIRDATQALRDKCFVGKADNTDIFRIGSKNIWEYESVNTWVILRLWETLHHHPRMADRWHVFPLLSTQKKVFPFASRCSPSKLKRNKIPMSSKASRTIDTL